MIDQMVQRILGDSGNSYAADDGSTFGVHVAYTDILTSMIFLAAIYMSGILSVKFLRMPSLVGEIFAGILLGPNLANIVPSPETFVLLGEIGLILLVLEAGIDIDLTTLKLIGSRGILIAMVGSFLPIAFAVGIAHVLGFEGMSAIAAGCCFAPTSLGIAMNVLRKAGIVNTPVGQLIVAAAIIDDMVALVILSQLQAFATEGATAFDMVVPIISALGFLVVGGGLAVTIIPRAIDDYILSNCGAMGWNRGWVSMAIMFSLMLVFMPMTYAAKSSPLLGAFLAGLVFCSNHEAHHMFVDQFKRVMQWLIRIFFAASIGFQVPIKSFFSAKVLLEGFMFTGALLGKILSGLLVPNFGAASASCGCVKSHPFRGHHLRDCLVVGFSMMAEGEFAFVIAVYCVSHQLLNQDQYAGIVLAVLLSTMLAPNLLRATLSYFQKQLESELAQSAGQGKSGTFDPTKKLGELEEGNVADEEVFFCVQTKSQSAWGLQMKIMEQLCSLHLDVIDHRSWHPHPHATEEVILVNEVYVKDMDYDRADMNGDETLQYVEQRTETIRRILEEAIGQPTAVVKAQRWVPYIPKGGLVSRDRQNTIARRILNAAKLFSQSRQKIDILGDDDSQYSGPHGSGNYYEMNHDSSSNSSNEDQGGQASNLNAIFDHTDGMFMGRLEGFFRHDLDKKKAPILSYQDKEGVELLDVPTTLGGGDPGSPIRGVAC